MIRTAIAFALALSAATCVAGECQNVRVEQAWIRQPPPGAAVAAGYFHAVNEARQAIVIENFTSSEFAHVMLHRTDYVEGRSSMRHLPELSLPAGSSFSASPGGAHLMLSDAGRPLAADMVLEFAAHCRDGSSLPVWFTVRRAAPVDLR